MVSSPTRSEQRSSEGPIPRRPFRQTPLFCRARGQILLIAAYPKGVWSLSWTVLERGRRAGHAGPFFGQIGGSKVTVCGTLEPDLRSMLCL